MLPLVVLDIVRLQKGGKVDVVRVNAKLLIPGRGLPIENGMILINGNKIVHAGTKLDATEMEKYNYIIMGSPCFYAWYVGCSRAFYRRVRRTKGPFRFYVERPRGH